MKQPCEFVSYHVLPLFHSLLAQELIEKYGLSRVEVARRLKMTPAAISQYLSSKRGNKGLKEFSSIPYVRSAISKTASEIASSRVPIDIMEIICGLCKNLIRQYKACKVYGDPLKSHPKCLICCK